MQIFPVWVLLARGGWKNTLKLTEFDLVMWFSHTMQGSLCKPTLQMSKLVYTSECLHRNVFSAEIEIKLPLSWLKRF